MPLDISSAIRARIQRTGEEDSSPERENGPPANGRVTIGRRQARRVGDRQGPPATVPGQWPILPSGNQSPDYVVAKRLLDLAGATTLLVLLFPILLVTFLVLSVTTRGRPFFCQERVGYLGRPFRLYKFRTMVLNADQIQKVVANEQDGPVFKNRTDPRITRIGRFLRVTSIDEMPQLINVLRGEMSLVGPRPPLAAEVAEYRRWQRIRLAVKPGLTCLWQVSGRSEIGFSRWMLMDRWYVKHQNLITDLVLLVRTPWAVITRRGAY